MMFAHPSRHHAARLFRVETHEAWTIRTRLAKINIDYAMTHMAFTDPLKLDDWDVLLDRILTQPPCYRDLADWWWYFAALEASTGFQLEICPAAKREQQLTGCLLGALSEPAKRWGEVIAPAVKRSGATLATSDIDLELGGGEQATGGDFGLILDFDDRAVQPGEAKRPDDRRIVPLIFQAKRHARPDADVSQTHLRRGPQRTLLASNTCASAYIFYDNLGNPETPLPPLVKPVAKVPHAGKTDVLEDSLDLATYLLQTALVVEMLRRESGTTLDELTGATSCLPHTTRAALTGLRTKGHDIDKRKRGAVTCYHLEGQA